LKKSDFQYFRTRIESLFEGGSSFEILAIEIFHFQAARNPVYKKFIQLIGIEPFEIEKLTQIPFLPISFFKNKEVKSSDWKAEKIFQSSGTTGQTRSRHQVLSLDFYHSISARIFENRIGNLADFQIIGLLPTYLENPDSSLISMVKAFGIRSGLEARFCGLDFNLFSQLLERAREAKKKILIFSVTYALIKLIDTHQFDLSDCIVIETGGMKGLGTEISKNEVIEKLQNQLKIKDLYSEYGMTELLSQAYAKPELFHLPPTLKVFVRDIDDPFKVSEMGRGAANIIDLANFATCSFIGTDDLCEVGLVGNFQILGRLNGSDLRGCNLLFG